MKSLIVSKSDAMKTLAAILACSLALILVVVGAITAPKSYLAQGVSAADRRVPVYAVSRDDNRIAISFDAAWGSEKTLEILDILDDYNVKTTFFLVGFWVDAYPERTQQIAQRGHEIGNHSTNHPNMPTLSPEQMQQEILQTHQKIEELTGTSPTLFRPPFGDYNNDLIDILHQMDYECIQWSIDSLDWKDIGTEAIVQRVTSDVQGGDIILFHNNSEDVLEFLPLVLEELQRQGFEIVPISQLLLDEPYTIDNNGIMRQS